MTTFQDYANYYNLLYKDKNYQSEADYIIGLLKEYSKIPITEILDLGCGTGKHDILLAETGFTVTGIDLSEKMIGIANKQKNKNTNFFVGDVRNAKLEKKFDAVISLFHVASYQTSNEDFGNYIKTAYDHLKPGGIFIFDFWYGPAVLTDLPQTKIKRVDNEEFSLMRFTESKLHPNENVVEVKFDIIVENKSTKIIEKTEEIHRMRYWFLPEIEFIAKLNGFKILDNLKWNTINEKLDFNTWYGLTVLQKK